MPGPSSTPISTEGYAAFWRRLLAAVIDGFIINIIFFILGFFIKSKVIFTLSPLICWFYFALLESSSKQATLGKMVMRIVVTDLDGNKISLGQASLRYLGKYVSSVILLVGFIMAAFTEKRQALHDIIAKTLVLKKS